MLNKIALTNVPVFSQRGISRSLLVAAVLGLTMFYQPELNAATPTTVAYLQQIPVSGGRTQTYPIPAVLPGVGVGMYGPFNLPGYGWVFVNLSCQDPTLPQGPCQVPGLTWTHNKAAENQTTQTFSNQPYNWGSDTNTLALYNTSGDTEYWLTFYFQAAAAPDPSDLVLVVAGLESGTTATVSGRNGSGPAILGNTNGGEYTFPVDPKWSCWKKYGGCTSSAPTVFPTSGALTFSSGFPSSPNTDERNTGWDLYQPNSPGLRMLSIQVAHVFGDGIGFTLGYRACNTLVGNSPYIVTPVTPANGDGVLYDINTVTGAALLPGLKLPVNAFGIAFTPSSPSGTLYALANHGLYSVNPMGKATLVATPIPSTSPGGLAADPSTGILYGVDRMGNLFKVISGVVTSVGRVGGTYSHGLPQLSAMAFDNSGNLFIVDDGLYLLKVSAPVSPTTVTSATGITLTGHTNLPGIGLAIDPLGGTAYYAQHDQLYTLDLTTGTLGLIGKLGIPFDPGTFLPGAGYLEGLTFVESPLPPSGVCPASPLPSPLPSPTLCCSQT